MFPIPWNFPFRKKNGDMSTIGAEIGGAGSELPPHSSSDAGKLLGVKPNGSLEWSDTVNSEIQTLTNNVDVLIENGAINNLPSEAVNATVTTDGANLTFTVNDDKSVTVNGTNGNSTVRYSIFASAETPQTYKAIGGKGPYKISGVNNGSANTYFLVFQASNTTSGAHAEAHDLYDGEKVIGDYSYYRCYIVIKAGVTLNNVKFEPMMTSPFYSGDYVPYAMTNRELTENVLSTITTKFIKILTAELIDSYNPITIADELVATDSSEIVYVQVGGNDNITNPKQYCPLQYTLYEIRHTGDTVTLNAIAYNPDLSNSIYTIGRSRNGTWGTWFKTTMIALT